MALRKVVIYTIRNRFIPRNIGSFRVFCPITIIIIKKVKKNRRRRGAVNKQAVDKKF